MRAWVLMADNPREDPELSGMQSVNRAFDVLFLLAGSSLPRTASSIASELDLPRPTVYRILATLGGKGVVAKVPDGFGVTEKLGRIASGTAGMGLADIIAGHLQTLVGLTRETSGLHVRVGDVRRCVAEVEGYHDIRWARGVGFTAPVWSGAVGHVLLAGLSAAEVSDIASRAGFARTASNTARGPDELLLRVDAARHRGWSLSMSETIDGAAAVAAPITDHHGTTVGVLSLYAPADRFDAIQECVPDLLSIAAEASAEWTGMTSTALVGVSGKSGDTG